MKILQKNVKPAEYVRTVWAVRPDAGTSVELLKDKEYWTHVAKTVSVGDRIEAVPEDNSWFAEFLIKAKTENDVTVFLLRYVPTQEIAAANDDEFTIMFAGGAKWRVLRNSDKSVMIDKLDSRDEAAAWLNKYIAENKKAA